MRRSLSFVYLASFLALSFVMVGCGKKAADQSMMTEGGAPTGFDTLATTEELAQLPQANMASQQGAVEVLPIEPAPVTQPPAMTMPAAPTSTASSSDIAGLSHSQKIQTALKNAGLYQGAIDGKIGPASRRAIEEFQRKNNLTVDGKVGPKTWAALEPFLHGAPMSGGETLTADDE